MKYLLVPFTALGTLLIIFSTIKINNSEFKKSSRDNNTEFQKSIDDEINPLCIKNKSFENDHESSNYIEKISITIPNSRGWSKNIFEAYISPLGNISGEYKKRFNAKLYWDQTNGYSCKFDAKVRISGDLRDHIAMISQNLVASLDVSLKNGNLNGFVRFKLLLPETRNGNSEIFTALLMKELGFISPRTHFIDLSVNGVSYRAIAQENPVKEMLENNKRRESAVLEINEDFHWNRFSRLWHSPKIINSNWLKKNKLNVDIGIDALNLFSIATNEVDSFNKVPDFKDQTLSGFKKDEKEKLSVFRAISIANGATHGLSTNDRRFYYNPLKKSLEPIYYDGQSRIMIPTWKNRELIDLTLDNLKISDLSLDDIKLSKKKINSINKNSFLGELNKSGLNMNLIEINQKLEKIKLKLNQLEKLVIDKNKKNVSENIAKFKEEGFGRIYYYKDNFFTICKKNITECRNIEIKNLDDMYSIIRGKYKKNNSIYLYSGLNPKLNNEKELLKSTFRESLTINKVSVLISGNPKLHIDKKRKKLKIKLFDIKDKVIFMGGNLIDWNIVVEAKEAENIVSESRYDKSLITGSINFLDINVSSLKIKMNGGLNEDSINFVRSSGEIDEINVSNSFQDAVDFDFSNLIIKKIFVFNAGNDCLDLSSGNYLIKKSYLSNCKDKAISLGENGFLNLEQGQIYNSFSALVVKDSSKMFASNIQTGSIKNCYLVYRKKQEFGNSSLNLKNFFCKEGVKYVQENSRINSKS